MRIIIISVLHNQEQLSDRNIPVIKMIGSLAGEGRQLLLIRCCCLAEELLFNICIVCLRYFVQITHSCCLQIINDLDRDHKG